jgi:Tfp pilus assembly protein PilN
MDSSALTDWDIIESRYYGEEDNSSYSRVAASYSRSGAFPAVAIPIPGKEAQRPDKREKKNKADPSTESKRRQIILDNYKRKERSISRKRLKETIAVLTGIAIVAVMFGSVLFKQAQITSLNFQNNAAQKRISALNQESAQLREFLISGADLEQIRMEATERLEMQEPGSQQIVSVELPETDKLITSISYNSVGVSPEVLAQAKEDLAKYYAVDS